MNTTLGLFISTFLLLTACAAVQTSYEYADLDIKTASEKPVFIRNSSLNTLHLRIDCPVTEFQNLSRNLTLAFESKGYRIVPESEAGVIIDILVRDNGVARYSARAVQGRKDHTVGAAALTGTGAGYLSSGDLVGAVTGGFVGLAAGGVADVTLNSWVHLGVLDINAAVLVREKEGSAYRESQTVVTVRAKQEGLKISKAAPFVEAALVKELSNILPNLQSR